MELKSVNNDVKLTIILVILLVAVTAADVFLQSLGLFNNLLNCDNPAVSLFGGGGFETVLMRASLERKLVEALLGDLRGIALDSC